MFNLKEKYLNPFTDFGFKKLFGEEPNKDLLISFLNALLPEKHHIEDLQYTKNEYQGGTEIDRKAIFDLTCTSTSGERFIVELQKAKQNYFKDRSIYYSTFPIQEQAQKGQWDFKLSAVYTVGILDFIFNEDVKEDNKEVIHTVKLKNQNNTVFYDKLTFIYLTLPCFNKNEDELETLQDKWMYVFKNMQNLDHIPNICKEEVFLKLFSVAELAKLNAAERKGYEESLKHYRDLKNVTDTAHEEGRKEGEIAGMIKGEIAGIMKGKIEVAKQLLSIFDDNKIAEITGLSVDDIRGLR
jgi:predicted transposase/invertase (TIGR01784 family)